MPKLATDFLFSLTAGQDAEQYNLAIEIVYRFDGGEFYIDDAHVVEPMGGIYSEKRHEAPAWLWRLLETDADILRECWADADARAEYARDQHADMARDERMLERGQ